MKLTARQKDMLDGRLGWPLQIAMQMLVAVGKAYDADELIPVGSVHLGISGVTMASPGMRFLEKLVAHDVRFTVPVTLNILSIDRSAIGTVPAIGAQEQEQLRIVQACETLGARPTYTCNPFLVGVVPAPGESVAWNESATAPYVNAVLGARTNREGASALASAITGLTPRYGMHVPRNRFGGVVLELAADPAGADAFSLLGGAVGRAAGDAIPVIEGLARVPDTDEMTAFCAAFAAISPLAMFHIVGVTPEASTRADALGDRGAARHVRISPAVVEAERCRYETARGNSLDVVVIGCPHASLEQLREIAAEIAGQRIDPAVKFLVQLGPDCVALAETTGLAVRLVAAGITLLTDSCVHVAYDQIPQGCTLATNSLKLAYLTASHHVDVRLGTLRQCIRAAVAGRWTC
jgi:predicted aconitase